MSARRRRSLTAIGPIALTLAAALVGVASSSAPVHAFEPFAFLIPCRTTAVNSVGTDRPCITCHDNADGGGGCATAPCLNSFGLAFNANGRAWDATLAMQDSDGDGYTNGEELGDPMGTWDALQAFPMCRCPTRPGFGMFTPGDTDADMDGFCCIGRDLDGNGDCLGAGENDGSLDCDESTATVNSGAAEMCVDPVDNDCDGDPTLSDSDCASVVDQDGDGFCPMGEDMNGDRDCTDPGEATADIDCDDTEATVSPAAGENCVDGLDNDCDMLVDAADPDCTSDRDADGDGFCPIGADLDMNGDCNGPGELSAGFDCDDSSADVNPGQTEICTDGRDNECDGLVDFRDTEDCGSLFDADGDGYCPGGQDLNRNGNCADPGEDAGPGDCDDADATRSPGLTEQCTDADVDEDCDALVSLADPDCAGYIDTDGDGFCFVGRDMDADGFCTGMDEADGRGDCDEMSVDVRPTAAEVCTDGVDNDCDGSADAAQFVICDDYRDRDRDHWCFVGQDLNDDHDCADAGEQGALTEWTAEMDPHTDHERFPESLGTEEWPTRYPGAPEHCLNQIDEDLDGQVDEAGYCVTDVDADGDGYCPLGTDLDGDGDCDDAGENTATTDCHDGDDTINPGQMERCREPVDADCDGDVGVGDADCFFLLDRDGDGVCGTGVDDNGDGDCLDESEQRFGEDCDDRDPAISSRAREVCDDGVDNDCDGDVDIADSQCTCTEASECDDGDPCTDEVCSDRGECQYAPNASCGDAGVPMADGGPAPASGGCSCRVGAPSSPHAPAAPLGLLALLGLALVTRRWRRARPSPWP